MQRFWELIVEPLFEILQPEVIVEIGSDQGGNTTKLLDYGHRTGAKLHAIDPTPSYDVSRWRREYGDTLTFHQSLSLDALPHIQDFDAVLIDGDHNWYTVYNELRLIEKLCQERSRRFPLVLLHDVGWPYGRRDLYYAPETIPEEHRKPHERKGLMPGNPGLQEEGGINQHLFNAVREGEPREGVLTAMEDFLDESEQDIELVILPGMHGLGMLIPGQLKANAELADFLKSLHLSPFAERYVAAMERACIESKAFEQERLAAAHAHLREERRRSRHVSRLVHWMQTLEEAYNAMLKSRQYRAGRILWGLHRKVLGKSGQPTAAEQQMSGVFAKFRAWEEENALDGENASSSRDEGA